jgi:hypothetical protein
MSPLLGALGDSSEYAYRGSLDDVPNDFSFTNVTNANPGTAYTSGPVTITGINNKVLVTVSAGASIAVNSGIFTSGPTFVRSGETISLYTPTTSGSDADFNKSYTVTATVGKKSNQWVVTTRTKDTLPTPFTFNNLTNRELGITTTSNTITISGLEATLPSNATITSGIGSFSKNGGAPGTATTIGNGDTIAIVLRGPTDYSSTNTTGITVGTYTTTFSVSTRAADTTVDQFVFTNFTNVGISSAYDSNSITLTGADNNTDAAPVRLTATVTGGFLKVVRGSETVRDFGISSATVYNGDILTLKLNSSPSYSTSTSAILTVSGVNNPTGVSSTFTVTTRPIVSDTIPNQFTFVDKTGQGRNISTISDSITLSGITTHADDFATAFLSNNASGGEFRVTRNGSVARGFSTESALVRNGDVIDLRITTSPASSGSVQVRFNVSGTDNTDIESIVSQTINDTWVVDSAKRNCPLEPPSLTSITKSEPSTLRSVTFTPSSYDNDCRVTVNTSSEYSYLDVNGTTGNDLVVLPGVACTVYMTSGAFSETRTTTITLTANNNVPSIASTSTTWSVTTRAITTPTVNISADPSSVSCGEYSDLTWSSSGASTITTDGFTGVSTSGTLEVGPLKKTTTYSITATGTDGTTSTSSVTVNVASTASATLSADSTQVDYNGSVTLTWNTSNASSVVSNFGVTATSGSTTLYNLKEKQTYTLRAVSNNSCADSATQTVVVNVDPCTKTTTEDQIDTGVTINYTYGNAGNGFAYYYSSRSGSGLNNLSREIDYIAREQYFDGTYKSGRTEERWTVPSNVNTIYAEAKGAGGAGGGGGPVNPGGGGGGGGIAYGTFAMTPGSQLNLVYGPSGSGGPSGSAGNTSNNRSDGGTGTPGGTGQGTVISSVSETGGLFELLRGRGGYGGGRNIGGAGGGAYPYIKEQTYNGDNVNNLEFHNKAFGRTELDNGGTAQGEGGGYVAPSYSLLEGGNTYRKGGSGGGTNSAGSKGTGGLIYLAWSEPKEAASWNILIGYINDGYKSSFNRPATSDEMTYWIDQYINYRVDTVQQIKDAISLSGAYKSTNGAVDECGNAI